MAHALGKKLSITPAEALRDEIERTAGGVAWLDEFLQGIDDPAELLPSGKHGEYTALWQKERAHLVRATTAAIGAGVLASITQRDYEFATSLSGVLMKALAELNLPLADEERVKELMAEKFYEMSKAEM